MNIQISNEIRIPHGPSYESGGWEKYVRREYNGGFNFDLPGIVLFELGARLPVFLHRGCKLVATAIVTEIDLRLENHKQVTNVMFDHTEPYDKGPK